MASEVGLNWANEKNAAACKKAFLSSTHSTPSMPIAQKKPSLKDRNTYLFYTEAQEEREERKGKRGEDGKKKKVGKI